MADSLLHQTMDFVAEFYDHRKVGNVGHEGYRKSTDLARFGRCAQELATLAYIDPQRTLFLDLGCGDGRVNVLMSYFVKKSIGIEIDAAILAEFFPLKEKLLTRLQSADLLPPPDNIALFHGCSLEDATYERTLRGRGVRFAEIDLFYTYITLHDLFAEKIAREAKRGALYLVYGFSGILPRYRGLEVMSADVAGQKIAALYCKR